MKKFIVSFAAIISMMIFIASPMFVRPVSAHADSDRYQNISELHSAFSSIEDENYIFFNITVEHDNNITDILSHGINLNPDLSKYNISFENNILDIAYINTPIQWYYKVYNGSNYSVPSGNYPIAHIYFDFENNKVKAVSTNNYWQYLAPWSPSYQNDEEISTGWYEFTDFDTDMDLGINLDPLNLSVSFEQDWNGLVSINSITQSGVVQTSDSNLMYVTNNGQDAQVCFAIVPHLQGISFNSGQVGTNALNGNATYLYVADEWNNLPTGLSSAMNFFTGAEGATSVYAPSYWHAVASGESRTFRLSWESMKLLAGQNYDAVVYATLNNGMTSTNSAGYYSVSTDYSDVVEVYRSSFTMKESTRYNENYKGIEDSAHPWNPDKDNSNLFSINSAFKDSQGNIHIKNYQDIVNQSSNSSSLSSVSTSSFGGFFTFMRNIFNFFPASWLAIISYGLTAMVVIGIIKVVSSS